MNIVKRLIKGKTEEFLNLLKDKGFIFKTLPTAIVRAEGEGIYINLYNSGKVLFQGKNLEEIVNSFPQNLFYPQTIALEPETIYLGGDESGKGDYFGPLVCCVFLFDPKFKDEIKDMPIRDSKKLTTLQVFSVAKRLIKLFPHKLLILPPKEYNTLYSKIKNLNYILSKMYIRGCKEMIEKFSPPIVIIDQFSNKKEISRSLNKLYPDLKIKEVTGAEEYLGVACASIVARFGFLAELKKLSNLFNFPFPLGSGTAVRKAKEDFCKLYSREKLFEVGKLNFCLTPTDEAG